MRPFTNGLSKAEAERLAILMEEMAEAQQVIGKILRHGYESMHPKGGLTNRGLLEHELGHVRYAILEMYATGDLMKSNIHHSAETKKASIRPYLHHQGRRS